MATYKIKRAKHVTNKWTQYTVYRGREKAAVGRIHENGTMYVAWCIDHFNHPRHNEITYRIYEYMNEYRLFGSPERTVLVED